MSKFILNASGTVELNISVARDGEEENFVFDRVDHGENVDVRAGNAVDSLARVGAGDVGDEGVFGDIDRWAVICVFDGDFEGVGYFDAVGEGGKVLSRFARAIGSVFGFGDFG